MHGYVGQTDGNRDIT